MQKYRGRNVQHRTAKTPERAPLTRRFAELTTITGLALLVVSLVGVPLALANHGVLVEGNPTCESVGFGGSTEVNSDPAGSTETIGPVTFTYPSSQTVDITIAEGFAIDAVIVKAADAYLYTTPPFSGLQAPLNNGG